MQKSLRRRARLRGFSIHRLLPNLVTLASLCAGLTGLRFAMAGDYHGAVVAVMAAAVLDSLDGRLARRLNVTSHFGAELDSLSDFVCFGAVPGLIMYLAVMSSAGALGWVITLMFPICSALRLARFNTALFADKAPPPWAGQFFTGVPAPAGAMLVMLPLMASFVDEGSLTWLRHPALGAVFLIGIGGLMVSRLPSFSLKKGRVPRHWVLPILLAGALLVAMLVSTPWATMPLLGIIYLLTLPFAWRARRRLEVAWLATQRSPEASVPGAHSLPENARPADGSVVPLRPVGEDRG